MIFQHTIDAVLSGRKTQTRRKSAKSYQVGKVYAAQPGRGKRAVGRIRVTRIWQEDVRNISDEGTIKEGFWTRSEFWKVWCEMHDKSALPIDTSFSSAREHLYTRPDDRYLAWVIEFELVERYI